MIKKIAVYGFILIANIIILAHAVIPHHHHDSVICFEHKHCHDEALTLKHNSAGHDHQHDGNNKSNCCILKQSVVVVTSQGKLLKNYNNCSDNHIDDNSILTDNEYVDQQTITKFVFYLPENPSYLTSFVTSTLGLRAPPAV